MATVPAVAYLGDRYKFIEDVARWNRPIFDKRGFEDGQPGEVAQNKIKDENQVPLNDYSDGWDGFAGGSFYDIDPISGTEKVCRTRVLDGTKGATSVGGSIIFDKEIRRGETVYVGCKVLFPVGFDMNAVNGVTNLSRQKFLRVRNWDVTGTSSRGYNDLYIIRDPSTAGRGCQFEFLKEGETPMAQWRQVGDRSNDIELGRWYKFQMAVHADSTSVDNGGKGRVEFFMDGERIANLTDVKTMELPDDVLGHFLCFTYWDDKTASSEQTWYIDDAFVSNLTPDGSDSNGNPRFNQ